MSKKKTRLGFWESKYETGHTPWDLGQVSPAVRELAERHFPPKARVFVPGCGRGYEAVYLAQQGYDVTAVDFAEAPLAHLRQIAEEAQVAVDIRLADMFALTPTDIGTFDVLLEQTCFCAIDPTLYADYEEMAYRLLRPGGHLLGVFMEVEGMEGPPYDCPPDLVKAQFPEARWRLEWERPLPRNPQRPGPEFLAAFTRLPVEKASA